MTAPMMGMDSLDPRIQLNVQQALAKKVPPETIRDILRYKEQVDPDVYLPLATSAPEAVTQKAKNRLQQPVVTSEGINNAGRGIGLMARGVVQGADVLGAEGRERFAQIGQDAQQYTPGGGRGLSDLVTEGATPPAPQPAPADELGLPTPNTPGEKVAVAAAEGGTTALPFAAMAPVGAALGATGQAITGAMGMAAGQQAANQGYGPWGQILANLVVNGGTGLFAGKMAGTIRSVLVGMESRRNLAREALDVIQDGNPNAAVSLGQVAQSSGGKAPAVEGAITKIPAAVGVFNPFYRKQAQELGERRNAISGMGEVTAEDVGMRVQKGLEHGWLPRMKQRTQQLYDRVYSRFDPKTRGQPHAMSQFFDDQSSLNAADRPLSDNFLTPQFTKWAEELEETIQQNPTGLQFETMKNFRTKLGDMLEHSTGDIDAKSFAGYKQLWAAATKDMTDVLQQNGGSRLLGDWTKANDFYAQGMEHLAGVVRPLINKGSFEEVYGSLMSGTKVGADHLRKVMGSLLPNERELVQAHAVQKLGRANPGMQNDTGDVFSTATFLRNWSTLADEAKDALYAGVQVGGLRSHRGVIKDLNKLAKAANIIEDQKNRLPNVSGTAQNTTLHTIIREMVEGMVAGGAGAATGQPLAMAWGAAKAVGAAGPPLVAHQMAKMMTNPRIVRWMVSQREKPFGQMAQQIALLEKQSENWDPESQGLAEVLVDHFKDIDLMSLIRAHSTAP